MCTATNFNHEHSMPGWAGKYSYRFVIGPSPVHSKVLAPNAHLCTRALVMLTDDGEMQRSEHQCAVCDACMHIRRYHAWWIVLQISAHIVHSIAEVRRQHVYEDDAHWNSNDLLFSERQAPTARVDLWSRHTARRTRIQVTQFPISSQTLETCFVVLQ